jgi:hypothetical protein
MVDSSMNRGAVHHFKRAADQGNDTDPWHYDMHQLPDAGNGVELQKGTHYFNLPSDRHFLDCRKRTKGGFFSLFSDQLGDLKCVIAWIVENGIGQGVPVDCTVAAEYFRIAADSGNLDGANNFGACLERGEGIDADAKRAVFLFQKAAAYSHRDALYNCALLRIWQRNGH